MSSTTPSLGSSNQPIPLYFQHRADLALRTRAAAVASASQVKMAAQSGMPSLSSRYKLGKEVILSIAPWRPHGFEHRQRPGQEPCPADIRSWEAEIRDCFTRHGVRYLIGKSGAILLGFPDTTQDADLFVDKTPANGERSRCRQRRRC